jgi:predicted amidohydrolase YtcJ
MAQEAQHQQQTISAVDLYKAAEAVARSGRRQVVRLNGTALAITPQEPRPKSRAASRRGHRRENGFLAAYGSVPPLTPPRTLTEQTEIAAEEAAQEVARAGLPPHANA